MVSGRGFLSVASDTLADCLNPDGTFTDEDRARRRGLTLAKQQADGMSELRGWLTPEARATLEAVLAKLGAPGMCNPHDDTACVDGPPSQTAIDADTRSPAQRHHDALTAAVRALLASGKLGQHNGLPASIIVSTTLAELEAAAGRGLTGGGTILPMSDVIRLARHARHFLAIFDKGKAVALYHTKRLASPGQRSCCTPRTVGAPHLAAPCPATTAKSTTSPPTPHVAPPTSTSWPLAVAHNTASSSPGAGPPEKTPAATPKGSHPHTSTTANREPLKYISKPFSMGRRAAGCSDTGVRSGRRSSAA